MADYPCNFVYHGLSNPPYLSWDAAPDAEMYWIEKKVGEMGAWTKLCEVPVTDYTVTLSPGIYYLKGKKKKNGIWEVFGPPEMITV